MVEESEGDAETRNCNLKITILTMCYIRSKTYFKIWLSGGEHRGAVKSENTQGVDNGKKEIAVNPNREGISEDFGQRIDILKAAHDISGGRFRGFDGRCVFFNFIRRTSRGGRRLPFPGANIQIRRFLWKFFRSCRSRLGTVFVGFGKEKAVGEIPGPQVAK